MADSGPKAGAKGVLDDVKGKAKEMAGAVTGNESLEHEGEAQQDKASSERQVAKHEAKAEAERADAERAEAEQHAHERSK